MKKKSQANALNKAAAAPREAPEAQAEHEGGDDDRHRLDVDAENREERPLPDDLVDQRVNSSERRLARLLLQLCEFEDPSAHAGGVVKIDQAILAEVVGTTRSRVSFFMNRFRKLGFIEYNGGLSVHSSLLNVVLHD